MRPLPLTQPMSAHTLHEHDIVLGTQAIERLADALRLDPLALVIGGLHQALRIVRNRTTLGRPADLDWLHDADTDSLFAQHCRETCSDKGHTDADVRSRDENGVA